MDTETLMKRERSLGRTRYRQDRKIDLNDIA